MNEIIDALDRAGDGGAPKAQVVALQYDFCNARRAEEAVHMAAGVGCIGFIIALLAFSYQNPWNGFPMWASATLVVMNAIQLLLQYLLNAIFPVLTRRERVAALLNYFDVDLPIGDGRAKPPFMPQRVSEAIRTLERAHGPRDVGGAYTVVEQWTHQARRVTFDQFYSLFLWCVLVVLAFYGDAFTLPDFWRGAAAGCAALMVVQYLGRKISAAETVQRAEDAVARWRHLVPLMRELPQ